MKGEMEWLGRALGRAGGVARANDVGLRYNETRNGVYLSVVAGIVGGRIDVMDDGCRVSADWRRRSSGLRIEMDGWPSPSAGELLLWAAANVGTVHGGADQTRTSSAMIGQLPCGYRTRSVARVVCDVISSIGPDASWDTEPAERTTIRVATASRIAVLTLLAPSGLVGIISAASRTATQDNSEFCARAERRADDGSWAVSMRGHDVDAMIMAARVFWAACRRPDHSAGLGEGD